MAVTAAPATMVAAPTRDHRQAGAPDAAQLAACGGLAVQRGRQSAARSGGQ